jgi:hypothetical protein
MQHADEPKPTTKIEKLSVNVPLDLLHALDQLVKMNGPFARRHALHVAALRLGVAELSARPERLLEVLGHQG